MTREEAITMLKKLRTFHNGNYAKVIDMAIEALQFAEHFDLLKEYQSLEEVIRCKECQHYTEGHCYEFGGPMNEDDYCSRGTTEPTYKLSEYDEVIKALDNLKLEFTIHGTERVKRMVGDDHE